VADASAGLHGRCADLKSRARDLADAAQTSDLDFRTTEDHRRGLARAKREPDMNIVRTRERGRASTRKTSRPLPRDAGAPEGTVCGLSAATARGRRRWLRMIPALLHPTEGTVRVSDSIRGKRRRRQEGHRLSLENELPAVTVRIKDMTDFARASIRDETADGGGTSRSASASTRGGTISALSKSASGSRPASAPVVP